MKTETDVKRTFRLTEVVTKPTKKNDVGVSIDIHADVDGNRNILPDEKIYVRIDKSYSFLLGGSLYLTQDEFLSLLDAMNEFLCKTSPWPDKRE